MFFFRTSAFLLVAAVCAVAQNVYSGDYARASATSSAGSSFGASGSSGGDMEFIPVQEYKPHPSLSVGTGAYGAPSARSGYVEDDADTYSAQKTKTVTKVSQRVKSESGNNSGARGHKSLPSLSTSRLPAPRYICSGFGCSLVGSGASLFSRASSLPAILLAFPSVSYGFPNVNGLFGSSSGVPYAASEGPAVYDHINKFTSNGLSVQGDYTFIGGKTYPDVHSDNYARPSFTVVAVPTASPQGMSAAFAPQQTKVIRTTVTKVENSRDNDQLGSNRPMLRASAVPVVSGAYRPAASSAYRPVVSGSFGISSGSGHVGSAPFVRSNGFGGSGATTSATATSYSSSSSQAGSSFVE